MVMLSSMKIYTMQSAYSIQLILTELIMAWNGRLELRGHEQSQKRNN